MPNAPEWISYFAPESERREIFKVISNYEVSDRGHHFTITIRQFENGSFVARAIIAGNTLHTNQNPSERDAISELKIQLHNFIEENRS